MRTATATVCGGFPVLIEYVIAPAEHDVGLMDDYIDEMIILTTKGKPADFIVSKMTDQDYQNCEDACFENERAHHESLEDYRY